MSDLQLPKLSLSMEEGRIVSWLVADGDEVRTGQAVATVETDKADVDVEAHADGVIALLAAVDDVVPVDGVIARIEAVASAATPGSAAAPGAEDATPDAPPVAAPPAGVPADVAAPAPAAAAVPARAGGITAADLAAGPPPSTSFAAVRRSTPAPATPPTSGNGDAPPRGRRLLASPAARRRARELGVDLAAVAGRGPGGRIVADDVEEHAAASAGPAEVATVEGPTATPAVSARVVPTPSPAAGDRSVADLRPAVLAALVHGWQTIPHVNIGGELDAEGLVAARAAAAGTLRVSYTDLLLLALARALGDVPELAATVGEDGRVTRAGRIDLSLAVATPAGVVAPRIADVPSLGLPAIARERERLVDAARAGRLDRRDLAPGCCTLSNLGSYPVDFFTPVLSGPGACIVATGRIAQRVVASDGLIGVRSRIWANVCIDHRAADGEAGGRLLKALEQRISDLPRTI